MIRAVYLAVTINASFSKQLFGYCRASARDLVGAVQGARVELDIVAGLAQIRNLDF